MNSVLSIFSGNVSIYVTSLKERDHFLVHSKDLEILTSDIKKGQAAVDLVEVLPMEHKKHEFLVFRTRNHVQPGNYTINIGNLILSFVWSDFKINSLIEFREINLV